MRISRITINNFRSHTATDMPLTQLGCLIGENNAGKSSVLHALRFVLEEKKIPIEDFRDVEIPASVTVRFEDIKEADLLRVSETHRDRVREMVRDGALGITRLQDPGATAESKYLALAPKDPYWSVDALDTAIKGKRAGALRQAAVDLNPDLDDLLPQSPKKEDVYTAWQNLIDRLPVEDLAETPTSFKTGIGAGIKPLLPSVIYIEAVKDATLESKATGTSAFSKLLTLLFEEVSGQFDDLKSEFKSVHKKLSRVLNDDGTVSDDRLDAVKVIESTIEQYVQSSFPGITLRMNVPAPTLTTILAGSELLVDDGHEGLLASKGDGLKRTVLFALLRAYTSLRGQGLNVEADPRPHKVAYLLLFEEPELYLHPRGQRQLMAALETFSSEHQVLVTTHSPGFFRPKTKGFTKLQKTSTGVVPHPVDLEIKARDEYQLIQYENNEAAFFARTVVLVEGDSDGFTFPHLAKIMDSRWDHDEKNVTFLKIGGNGNIRRYRDFLNKFNVDVHVITDLDTLVTGFEQLTDSDTIRQARGALMSMVSNEVEGPNERSDAKVTKLVQRRRPSDLWRLAQQHLQTWEYSPSDSVAADLSSVLTELFDEGTRSSRLSVLKKGHNEEIAESRDALIASLAYEGVYVLRRGDLETYCGITAKQDKVAAAMKFCSEVQSLDDLKIHHGEDAGALESELRSIFARIYGPVSGEAEGARD